MKAAMTFLPFGRTSPKKAFLPGDEKNLLDGDGFTQGRTEERSDVVSLQAKPKVSQALRGSVAGHTMSIPPEEK